MCGVVDDAFNFVKDSVGEIFHHPLQALGAAAGVPGFDPFFGGLFNNRPGGALLSPTGNFTSSAWNDMYNANPSDSGALDLFHGVNAVADKVAPAIAGYYAAPALGGAFGGAAGDTGSAATIGADTFSTGLDTAGSSTLGGLESGMGGAGLFGSAAGTGTAIGSGVAQGLGAGGLGVADASALGGLGASSGTYAAGLGGGQVGTGLNSLSNAGANATGVGGTAPPVDLGGSGTSLEGSQVAGSAAPSGNAQAVASGAMTNPGDASGGTNLGTLFGPDSTAGLSPTGQAITNSTGGVGQEVSNGILGQGSGVGASSVNPSDIQSLFNLAKSGYGAYQQWHQGQQAQNYVNGINQLFAPNSPYAQQMQQTLARQDAAAGRNSQYGTRATQLAAALTQAQAQAMGNSNYANAAQNASKGNILNSLFSNFSNPQQIQGAYNLGSQAFNGLSSLFGG